MHHTQFECIPYRLPTCAHFRDLHRIYLKRLHLGDAAVRDFTLIASRKLVSATASNHHHPGRCKYVLLTRGGLPDVKAPHPLSQHSDQKKLQSLRRHRSASAFFRKKRGISQPTHEHEAATGHNAAILLATSDSGVPVPW